MRITARLPLDRYAAGTLEVEDDARRVILGPVRCRGEADDAAAQEHGNVQEDATRAYGDHPYGGYVVRRVVRHPAPARSYGPAFIALEPVDGEALEARRNGRSGFGLHGGALHPDGRLRETHGCNRVDDEVAAQLADLVEPELTAGRPVDYRCEAA